MTSSLEAKESYDFSNALSIAFSLLKLVKQFRKTLVLI